MVCVSEVRAYDGLVVWENYACAHELGHGHGNDINFVSRTLEVGSGAVGI